MSSAALTSTQKRSTEKDSSPHIVVKLKRGSTFFISSNAILLRLGKEERYIQAAGGSVELMKIKTADYGGDAGISDNMRYSCGLAGEPKQAWEPFRKKPIACE
tara:strand:- start:7104 stop:7412 length:309 start_codon:yes stop_codon:yes gene_type:complete